MMEVSILRNQEVGLLGEEQCLNDSEVKRKLAYYTYQQP